MPTEQAPTQSPGQVFGPLVMGLLYDFDRSGPFVINAIILIIGSALVWFVLKDPAGKQAGT